MIKIKDYFRFNSRERLAIILLTCLIGVFWMLPRFYPNKPELVLSAVDQSTLNNHIDINHSDSVGKPEGYREQNSSYQLHQKKPFDLIGSPKRVQYFYFDPNTIDEGQWRELGLRNKTIQTILNYRNKGGHFYQPDDLRKIWGLKPEEADLLVPYVQIPTNAKKGKEINLQKLNVNLATQEEWELFPGIGPVLAARIIKFRDKIGGFKTVEQVGKTYGISDSVFQKILPYLAIEENLPIK